MLYTSYQGANVNNGSARALLINNSFDKSLGYYNQGLDIDSEGSTRQETENAYYCWKVLRVLRSESLQVKTLRPTVQERLILQNPSIVHEMVQGSEGPDGGICSVPIEQVHADGRYFRKISLHFVQEGFLFVQNKNNGSVIVKFLDDLVANACEV